MERKPRSKMCNIGCWTWRRWII